MSTSCHLCQFMGYSRDVSALVDEARNFCFIDRCSSLFDNQQSLWEHVHVKHKGVKCGHCGKILISFLPSNGGLAASVNNLAKNIQNRKRKYTTEAAGTSSSSNSLLMLPSFGNIVGTIGQIEAPKKLRRFHDLLLEGLKIWDFVSYDQLKAYLSERSDDSIIALLVRSELLVSKRSCNKCGTPMKLRSRLGSYVKNNPTVEWRCRNNANGKKRDCSTQSCRNGSFFASSNSSLQNQVETLFQWKDSFKALDSSLASFSGSPLVKQFSDIWLKFQNLIDEERMIGQSGMFVDVLMFPPPNGGSDEQILIMTERKFRGRGAAMIIHGDPRSSTQFSDFVIDKVVQGSVLVFEEGQAHLAQCVGSWRTSTIPTFNSTQFRQSTNEVGNTPCIAQCRFITTTLLNSPHRCSINEIIQEAIIRFNNRENLVKLFWNLLSVENTVFFTKPRKTKQEDIQHVSQVPQNSSVLNTFLAFHGLANNL